MLVGEVWNTMASTREDVLSQLHANGYPSARWLAMDKDGTWFAYSEKPNCQRQSGYWDMKTETSSAETCFCLEVKCMIPFTKSWRLTLFNLEPKFEWGLTES